MTTENQDTKASSIAIKSDLMADSAYKALTQNIPLFFLRGLKKRHMDAIYGQAYYFYSQGKYQEALPLFKALTFYYSTDQKGWLGAGGCFEMLKQYELAISCYSFAAILDAKDPVPSLHAFDCQIALKNYTKALACLESVILRSSKKPEHAALKERAEFLRDSLQKNLAANIKS